MPFHNKDSQLGRLNSNAGLFVKGFGEIWSHQDLYDNFKEFGEIVSCKVSLGEEYSARGYGFVQYSKEEDAKDAMESVRIIFYRILKL